MIEWHFMFWKKLKDFNWFLTLGPFNIISDWMLWIINKRLKWNFLFVISLFIGSICIHHDWYWCHKFCWLCVSTLGWCTWLDDGRFNIGTIYYICHLSSLFKMAGKFISTKQYILLFRLDPLIKIQLSMDWNSMNFIWMVKTKRLPLHQNEMKTLK